MKVQTVNKVAKLVFCLAMVGAAISELIRPPVVVSSLIEIGIPLRLLYLLATMKLVGAFILLFSQNKRLQEWAYAGFFFNLIGAIYLLFSAGATILPDMVVAPVYLMLWLLTYLSYKRKD